MTTGRTAHLRRSTRSALMATVVFLAVTVLTLGGCTSDSGSTDGKSTSVPEAELGPKVVAATSWIAAIAEAAGANNVTIIAPLELRHPADYDPRPSDLAAVADAEFVMLGGFEGFADRLTKAAGSDAQVVKVNAVNSPDNLRAEVRKLGKILGTTEEAGEWVTKFDARIKELRSQIDKARPDPAPKTVAHKFMAPWAEFAGLDLVGTYGPQPVTPAQLAEFTASKPQLILDNAHVPVGSALDDLGAVKVSIINFPPSSLDLLDIFDTNTKAILAAFKEL